MRGGFGCGAVEEVKLLLEPAAIGVDVLDGQHALVHMFALAGDDEFVFDAPGVSEGDQRLVPIHAKQRIPLGHLAQPDAVRPRS